jgi:type IV pilus assembly protein PilA
LNLAGGAKAAVTEYTQDRGTFPADNTTAGISGAAFIKGKYVTGVQVAANGVVTVTYGNQAHSLISTKTIQLAPTTNAGSVEWACTSASGSIANKHLPAACRTTAAPAPAPTP